MDAKIMGNVGRYFNVRLTNFGIYNTAYYDFMNLCVFFFMCYSILVLRIYSCKMFSSILMMCVSLGSLSSLPMRFVPVPNWRGTIITRWVWCPEKSYTANVEHRIAVFVSYKSIFLHWTKEIFCIFYRQEVVTKNKWNMKYLKANWKSFD